MPALLAALSPPLSMYLEDKPTTGTQTCSSKAEIATPIACLLILLPFAASGDRRRSPLKEGNNFPHNVQGCARAAAELHLAQAGCTRRLARSVHASTRDGIQVGG